MIVTFCVSLIVVCNAIAPMLASTKSVETARLPSGHWQSETETAPLWFRPQASGFGDMSLSVIEIFSEDQDPQPPLGVSHFPRGNEMFVSPHLAKLIHEHSDHGIDPRYLLQRFDRYEIVGEIETEGLKYPSELIAYVGLSKAQFHEMPPDSILGFDQFVQRRAPETQISVIETYKTFFDTYQLIRLIAASAVGAISIAALSAVALKSVTSRTQIRDAQLKVLGVTKFSVALLHLFNIAAVALAGVALSGTTLFLLSKNVGHVTLFGVEIWGHLFEPTPKILFFTTLIFLASGVYLSWLISISKWFQTRSSVFLPLVILVSLLSFLLFGPTKFETPLAYLIIFLLVLAATWLLVAATPNLLEIGLNLFVRYAKDTSTFIRLCIAHLRSAQSTGLVFVPMALAALLVFALPLFTLVQTIEETGSATKHGHTLELAHPASTLYGTYFGRSRLPELDDQTKYDFHISAVEVSFLPTGTTQNDIYIGTVNCEDLNSVVEITSEVCESNVLAIGVDQTSSPTGSKVFPPYEATNTVKLHFSDHEGVEQILNLELPSLRVYQNHQLDKGLNFGWPLVIYSDNWFDLDEKLEAFNAPALHQATYRVNPSENIDIVRTFNTTRGSFHPISRVGQDPFEDLYLEKSSGAATKATLTASIVIAVLSTAVGVQRYLMALKTTATTAANEIGLAERYFSAGVVSLLSVSLFSLILAFVPTMIFDGILKQRILFTVGYSTAGSVSSIVAIAVACIILILFAVLERGVSTSREN